MPPFAKRAAAALTAPGPVRNAAGQFVRRPVVGSAEEATETTDNTGSPITRLAAANDVLDALVTRKQAILARLAEHREQRTCRRAEGGHADRVASLGADDDRLRMELAEIEVGLPILLAERAEALAAVREVAWQQWRLKLADVQQQTADAVRAVTTALAELHELQRRVVRDGFGPELQREFVAAPPLLYNQCALDQFACAVVRREHVASMAT
jgi:hypothetical protein